MAREREALAQVISPIQQAFSRYTRTPLLYRRPARSEPYCATFPIPRVRISRSLFVAFKQYFAITAGDISTTGYHYGIEGDGGEEIVVYHWHQAAEPVVPHLHVASGSGATREELRRAHLPTGNVSWQQFLWLVEQFAQTGSRR